MAKVSIIIPVFDAQEYLKRCLDSVVKQTLKDIEIICVNDCSNDKSLEILKEYQLSDNRIKIIDFIENKGVSTARNTGINEAVGEYIGFIDSDDYIDLDFYEKLYNKAIENNSNLAIGNIRYENINESFSYSNFIDKVKKNYLNFNVNFCVALYKTTFIKDNHLKFTEGSNLGEDRELPIKAVFLNGDDFPIVDNIFYTYFKNQNSLYSFSLNENKISGLTLVWKNIASFLKNSVDLTKNDYVFLRDILLKEYCQNFITVNNELTGMLSLNFIDIVNNFDKYKIDDDYLNKIVSLIESGEYRKVKEFVKVERYKNQIKNLREGVKINV